jgi:hypothetical protein
MLNPRLFTLLALLAAAAPLAAQQQAPASLSGTLADASGAVLPGVELRLTDSMFGLVYSRVTDGSGSFSFPELPAGRYELVANLPGFASLLTELTLPPGERVERRLSMRIGMVEETIHIGCSVSGAELAAGTGRVAAFERRSAAPRLFPSTPLGAGPTPLVEAQQKPVRVGGQIRAPGKIKDVKPICPRGVRPPLFNATIVRLEATIGTDGLVKDVRPLSEPGAEPPAAFVESAVEAVRQWQFSPTRLNNVAVPAIISVTVEYRRI